MADYQLRDSHYRRIRDLVFHHSSIELGENKKELVISRLGKRIRLLRLASFEEYLQYLEGPEGSEEVLNLVDAMSTNHTFFFREVQHFEFLLDRALPELSPAFKGAPLRIWSAACSTGEEAYSIAITCHEYRQRSPSFQYRVECTDISRRVLRKAEDGIFPLERLSAIPGPVARRYFVWDAHLPPGHVRIHPELRQPVSFSRLNLLAYPYPNRQPYPVIFLRNVLMYFNRETQEKLIQHMSNSLSPGGYLFIGHAENLNTLRHSLQYIQPAIYQKSHGPR